MPEKKSPPSLRWPTTGASDCAALKSSNVQRSKRVLKFERSVGDAPLLGHVPRMPRKWPSRSRRHRKHGEDYDGADGRVRRKNRTHAKLLVLGITTSILILGALCLWLLSQRNRADADYMQIPESPPHRERVISQFDSPSKEDSLNKVRQALLIRDTGKVGAYFRTGATNPTSVIAFLEGMAKTDGPVNGLEWLCSLDHNGILTEAVTIRTTDGTTAQERLALLTPDDKGVWKIDFDAFARTVRPSWKNLLDPNSAGGLVRVYIRSDNYYNRSFGDDSVWSCYQATSPDTDVSLLCYCKRNSPQHKAIKKILADDQSDRTTPEPVRVVMELRRMADSDPRQFEISGVLAEDWIVSSRPYDARFKD